MSYVELVLAIVDVCTKTTVEEDINICTVSGFCCSADACAHETTRRKSHPYEVCWPCDETLVKYHVEAECWIKYTFGDPQDLVEMRIEFDTTENGQTLNVYENGHYHSTIESSGKTNGYETFDLHTNKTSVLELTQEDYESVSDMWSIIKEVRPGGPGMRLDGC